MNSVKIRDDDDIKAILLWMDIGNNKSCVIKDLFKDDII